ncbi:MAG TPA: DNA internalization-related competence protein ComEC/Rec2 [Candidatus Latescibacteria bacterium]|nr:DNA internalization-related competence protein ComEC/Rec2 [Gemmatimonadaceae bacterium]MDP6018180.1 DNA internalization-related competence protein ComEC/Rec2 [Candidatus Latescibacterota bacterium]HJP33612.1 DNA internalization-related competence protein ComEC/Rec2 [Candidatus Latescibacterota bacterium]
MSPPSRRRPALWIASAMGAGIVADDLLAPSPGLWAAVALSAWWLVAVVLLASHHPRIRTGLLLLLAMTAGGLRSHQATKLLPPHHVRHLTSWGERGLLIGRVDGSPELRGEGENQRLRLTLRAESWQPEKGRRRRLSGQVLVSLREPTISVDGNDRLQLRCRLTRPQPARNPGAFDYRRFLALQGVHATTSVYRGDALSVEALPDRWWRQQIIAPLRRSASRSLVAHLSGAPAGLLRGMLLGDRHAIPEEVETLFRRTGLAHALVISGLHVGLVALFFFTAFRILRLPPAAAYLATTAVLVLYAFVTDLQPPVVRSTVMAAVIMVGRVSGRRGEVFNSLGLAALVILALWPASLLTLSFQLSFGATLAIVGLHGPLRRCLPGSWSDEERFVGRWIVSPACVSLAAQLGTGPFIAWHFQQFAPISLLANLVVVPLLGLCVGLGLLAVLGGSIWPPIALPFAGANYVSLTALIETVDAFARVPPLTTPRPEPLFLGCAALALVLVTRAATSRRARVALLLLLLGWANLSLWSQLLRPRQLEIVFLDVDQGDSAFLHFPGGRTMIIDAGIRSRRIDFGERVVTPFLRHRGITRVDVVIASHPHADHIGGLVHLLEEVEVGHYVDSGQQYDTWTARRVHELIAERGISYHRVRAGDSLAGLNGVAGLVLHPTEDFVTEEGRSPHGLNNGSVALRLNYGGAGILFTGDIEAETEPAMQAWRERLRADVLKGAHHGSRTSSGPGFLDAVDPRLAILSVGARNKFGHPAAEVLARLAERGTAVYRTDGCGAVSLYIDVEGGLQVEPMVGETCVGD